ncbi:DUF7693 family protein [Pseudomonas corrugata]|uniref:DUF7693 family protein n=1 Tax=Pseudomonas corrugata TaxID=47879 RepID=UPI003D9B4E34
MPVEIDGWRLTLFIDCAPPWATASPAGRLVPASGHLNSGTEPVGLMSAWERKPLERLLAAL